MPDPWRDPQTFAAIVVAISTVVYVVVTARILRASRDSTRATQAIFEAAHRPYVSVAGVDIGSVKEKTERAVVAKVVNFGSVPAQEYRYDVSVTREGKILDIGHNPTSTTALFPTNFMFIAVFLSAEQWDVLPEFTFRYKITYRGLTGHQHGHSAAYKYHDRSKSFHPMLSDWY